MRYREIARPALTEALDHSQRLLFHGTLFRRGADILADDKLDALTTDTATVVSGGKGVSLSRSYDFALNYRLAHRSMVFVLDARRLRTQPVAYWSSKDRSDYGRADEMEEYHVGSIDPLSRYLISINSPVSFEAWFAIVSQTTSNPYENPAKGERRQQAIQRGFPEARRLWNRWTPVRGIKRPGAD